MNYLLHCRLYADAKREIINYIQDSGTGVVTHSKGSPTVAETALLAPLSTNSVSKKDNNIIKEAAFQYIADRGICTGSSWC